MFYAPLLLFIAFVIAGGPIPISSSFYRYSDKYLAFNITFDQAIYVLDTISGDRLKLTSSKFRQIKIFACKQNIRKFYSISTLLHGMVNLWGIFRIECTKGTTKFHVPTSRPNDYCDAPSLRSFFGLPTRDPVWTFVNLFRNGITIEKLETQDNVITIVYQLLDTSRSFFKVSAMKSITCDFKLNHSSPLKLGNRDGEVFWINRSFKHQLE